MTLSESADKSVSVSSPIEADTDVYTIFKVDALHAGSGAELRAAEHRQSDLDASGGSRQMRHLDDADQELTPTTS